MTDIQEQNHKVEATKEVTREAADTRERLRRDLIALDAAVQQLKVTASELTGATPPPANRRKWFWMR